MNMIKKTLTMNMIKKTLTIKNKNKQNYHIFFHSDFAEQV